eukprot:7302886-Alexandrium_andersonii.AAC.1
MRTAVGQPLRGFVVATLVVDVLPRACAGRCWSSSCGARVMLAAKPQTYFGVGARWWATCPSQAMAQCTTSASQPCSPRTSR